MTFVSFITTTKIVQESLRTGDLIFLSIRIYNFCPRDNVGGGTNGPETVTFQDPSINNLYTYVVGIDDFAFENNGVDFFNSGSVINVANNLQTHDVTMLGNTGNSSNTYYFYGCIDFLQSKTILNTVEIDLIEKYFRWNFHIH